MEDIRLQEEIMEEVEKPLGSGGDIGIFTARLSKMYPLGQGRLVLALTPKG